MCSNYMVYSIRYVYMFKPNILSKRWKYYFILFLKILCSTNNRQSCDDSDEDFYVDSDYYDYDDHEDFGYCYMYDDSD